MKLASLLVLTVVVFTQTAFAHEVKVEGGILSVNIPEDFTALTNEEIQLKFPRNSKPPLIAYADSNIAKTIAVTWSEMNPKLTAKDLPALKLMMTSNFEKSIPNLKWIDNGLKQINNRFWVVLECEVPGVDTQIHNYMMFTEFNGGMFGVNFTSPEAIWEQFKPKVYSIAAEIELK